jgi:hypothetical protein
MNMSAPKTSTFLVAIILLLIAIFAYVVSIPPISPYAFWIAVIAFFILAAGTLVDGL